MEGRGPLPAGLEPYSCTETRGNGASQQGGYRILVNAVWRSLAVVKLLPFMALSFLTRSYSQFWDEEAQV